MYDTLLEPRIKELAAEGNWAMVEVLYRVIGGELQGTEDRPADRVLIIQRSAIPERPRGWSRPIQFDRLIDELDELSRLFKVLDTVIRFTDEQIAQLTKEIPPIHVPPPPPHLMRPDRPRRRFRDN